MDEKYLIDGSTLDAMVQYTPCRHGPITWHAHKIVLAKQCHHNDGINYGRWDNKNKTVVQHNRV
jgi:hypothetical protein